MRQSYVRRVRFLILVFSILAFPLPGALAQEGLPDITGSYNTAGTFSYVNCNVEGVPDSTFPLIADLTIDSQEGSHFSGHAFDDGQGGSFITFDGTVTTTGGISGTWEFTNVPGEGILNQTFTGTVEGDHLTVDFIADFGFEEEFHCSLLISLSSGAIALSWTAPEPASGSELPPPRDLVVVPLPDHPGLRSKTEQAPPGPVTGYKVYRSSAPGTPPSPNNIFATVPPTTTTVPAAAGLRGSYFVVTACYATGESAPSNEVVASATPGPIITGIKPKAKKVTFTGTGFVQGTTVQIDGVGFTGGTKLKKNNTQFVQKGPLANGQTLNQALVPGAQITFKNPDGGITNLVFQP
jgi:hypothetical protein